MKRHTPLLDELGPFTRFLMRFEGARFLMPFVCLVLSAAIAAAFYLPNLDAVEALYPERKEFHTQLTWQPWMKDHYWQPDATARCIFFISIAGIVLLTCLALLKRTLIVRGLMRHFFGKRYRLLIPVAEVMDKLHLEAESLERYEPMLAEIKEPDPPPGPRSRFPMPGQPAGPSTPASPARQRVFSRWQVRTILRSTYL